jgi:hypothetical protein
MAAAAGWIQKAVHGYARAMAERPYRTNMLTAGSSLIFLDLGFHFFKKKI